MTIKIYSGAMIIKIYADRIAEIHLDPAEEVPGAMYLARVMTVNNVAAAKIVKSNPAIGRPGIQVARNVKGHLTNVKA